MKYGYARVSSLHSALPFSNRPFSHFARANDLHGLRFWLLIAAEMLIAIGLSLVMMKLFDEPVRGWLTRKWRLWRSTLTRALDAA
jgi:peptidoglycan/LPS O-acetylase OafA/YrhL